MKNNEPYKNLGEFLLEFSNQLHTLFAAEMLFMSIISISFAYVVSQAAAEKIVHDTSPYFILSWLYIVLVTYGLHQFHCYNQFYYNHKDHVDMYHYWLSRYEAQRNEIVRLTKEIKSMDDRLESVGRVAFRTGQQDILGKLPDQQLVIYHKATTNNPQRRLHFE